jgi:hypothetical protein
LPIRRSVTDTIFTLTEPVWRFDRRVDDQLQRGIIIGLKTRIFEMQPAPGGMIEDLSA